MQVSVLTAQGAKCPASTAAWPAGQKGILLLCPTLGDPSCSAVHGAGAAPMPPT